MTALDLTGQDATDLAELVRSRLVTARELIDATLARIDDVEPKVNAFRVVMASQACADADRIDSLHDAELAVLPLAGVPVAIKDDTDVAGQSTRWGSAVDRGVVGDDAEVVERLRRAGAVVVGKTNVPELTLWPWTASKQWGRTANPWDLERTAGGSSGGSAAAVCTGMAAIALGSDGGGSIRYPAGLTGLVGLKPQRNRLPIGHEHASGWHGLLGLGPLARSVRDVACFPDVTAAPRPTTAYRDGLGKPVGQLRVAVSTNSPPGTQVTLSPERRAAVDRAAELCSNLGHQVVEADIDYGLGSLWNSTVRLLKGVQDDVDSLPSAKDLEARTKAVARLGRLVPRRTLRRALQRERDIARSINAVFDAADVVLTPLCATSAPLLEDCPDRGALRSLREANTSAWLVPWNVIGQPALSLPVGFDSGGLPTAVQLAGPDGSEAVLLALAETLEKNSPPPLWRSRR